MRVLVTGGTGFIGSHQVVALQERGHQVCVVDDLSNSSAGVLARIGEITGEVPRFVEANVLDTAKLAKTLVDFDAEAVIHFAALKSVPESTRLALDYHETNVGGLLSVLRAASDSGVEKIVFSSSGSIYGETDVLPIPESHPQRPSNPYSASKSLCERILSDACMADARLSVVALRYFNPAGAHSSGRIGEDPKGPPGNLVPHLMRVAAGPDPRVDVNGVDFETRDGSGVRDYIHVVDVAHTHLLALEHLRDRAGFTALNVGRGEGVSVLEMVAAAEAVTGVSLEVRIRAPRPGDVSALVGDTTLSGRLLGSIRYRPVMEILEDAWRWELTSRSTPIEVAG